ncbi:hypothetical protein O1611_g5951 [Lasiodiplodia mahajangana]|uniref:Uncharacterized protein n=1 Tax=Lasiodiplodia mahajangana TaxID=1108764 RepID=A0ACC2JJJ0_9PEZI|nr:hypothetical protein O1611_g5951 [Lasiodiplodia mahajangana]
MTTFQYSPLDASVREIRLFRLHPASLNSRDSTLEMTIIKCRLGNPIPYKALSYTWGDPEPTYPVRLDGCQFRIRKNLHEALLRIRPLLGTVKLWADAICINQDDMRERESQVTLMRDIYKTAQIVWAWLGPGNGSIEELNDEATWSFLSDLAERELSNISEDTNNATIPHPETREWIQSMAFDDAGLQRWLEMGDILSSPWFSRMWIIQEVVMGKTVHVFWGGHGVSWDLIYFASKFIEKYLTPIIISGRSSSLSRFKEKMDNIDLSANCISQIGHSRLAREGRPITVGYLNLRYSDGSRIKKANLKMKEAALRERTAYNIVSHYRRFKVTEPRDRVYSLLGLLEDLDDSIKIPDINYSIPLVDLYWSIIKPHIEHTGGLSFLMDAFGSNRPYGSPSWMPCWYNGTTQEDRVPSILSQELPPEITYNATANTFPFCYFNSRLKSLRIAGFFGAVVRQLGDVADPVLPDAAVSDDSYWEALCRNMEKILGGWISLLGLTDILFGPLPYQLCFDPRNPTEKEVKAHVFIATVHMIDNIHQWSDEELFDVYESQLKTTGHASTAHSASGYRVNRCITTIRYRRLFITDHETFGLCPRETQVGDVIIFLYGCRVPMILRRMPRLRGMWSLVGEAYLHGQMNGEMMDPDLVAIRCKLGLNASLFWIV